MARLRGERKRILDEAEQRLREAEAKLEDKRRAAVEAVHEVQTEQAVVNAIRVGYDALRQSLAPTPRQPAKPAATAAPTRVYERCTRCDKTKGHRFHKDSGDDGYHEFQSAPARQLEPCAFVQDGVVCNDPPSSPIHDPLGGYGNYHPFTSPAQPAGASSSRSNRVGGSTASTGMSKDAVPDAAHASVGGK
jgi:hypothetical protein